MGNNRRHGVSSRCPTALIRPQWFARGPASIIILSFVSQECRIYEEVKRWRVDCGTDTL